MTAIIIPFPGLIERVARRMLPVMDAPPGDQRDEVFGRATTELGVGLDGGLEHIRASSTRRPPPSTAASQCAKCRKTDRRDADPSTSDFRHDASATGEST